jgi:ABC-type sugar transport system ATPase subunit
LRIHLWAPSLLRRDLRHGHGFLGRRINSKRGLPAVLKQFDSPAQKINVRIYLRGRDIRYRIPAQAIRDGIAYATEDRKVEGLFEAMDATDNIGFGWLAKWTKGYRSFKRNKLKSTVHEWLQKLSI